MNLMARIMQKRSRWLVFPAVVGLWLGVAGCDDSSDNDFDHTAPAGQGALIVDNRTYDDINVYVDGIRVGKVGDYDDRAFDLNPGTHRVVLDQEDGGRNAADDIDILEGRLTVLQVESEGTFSDDYRLSVDYRD